MSLFRSPLLVTDDELSEIDSVQSFNSSKTFPLCKEDFIKSPKKKIANTKEPESADDEAKIEYILNMIKEHGSDKIMKILRPSAAEAVATCPTSDG